MGIVQAIGGCEAMVVVFSDAADCPPEWREMKLAVSNRKPQVTIRVADAVPTEMQNFLGMSRWFNA